MHSYEIFDPYPVSGFEIRQVAEQGRRGIDGLEQLEGDVSSAHQPAVDAVEGDIRPHVGSANEDLLEQSKSVRMTVGFAKGALNLFAFAVEDFNLNSTDPRSVSKLNAAYDSAASNNFGLDLDDYDDGGSKEHRDFTDDYTSESNALKAELRREYGRLENNLDSEAETISAMLNRGPNEADVRTMFGAGALPSYAAQLFPDYDLSGISFDRLPTDLEAMSNEELADFLLDHPDYNPNIMLNLDILAPGVVDVMGDKLADRIRNADITWDSGAEELQEYTDLLQTWQDSSLSVTAALYENLGAEGSLTFLSKIGAIGHDETRDDALDLASTFRRGFGLADAMWSEEESAQFGRDLGQAIEDNRADYPPQSYEASLSYLLEDQYYSTALLDPLGDKLHELDLRSNGHWDTNGSSLPADPDVMSSYFSALEKNGEAALNFFGDDAQRHEYYLQDREYLASPDRGMNNLLGALDAATTDEENLGDQDRQHMAAGLVSSIAEYLPDNEQATPDFVHSEGTEHLAHILGTYMESISNHMTGFEPNGERGAEFSVNEDGFASPYFEHGELKDLVKLTVSNEDGLTAMREGVSAYQNLELSRDMADGSISEATLRSDARLEGFFMDAVGEQKIEGAEQDDKRVKAWIDMGKNLVGAIPLPGAQQVGVLGEASLRFLANQAGSSGATSFTEAFANAEETAWNDATDASIAAHEARQIAIATQLADPGTYDLEPIINDSDLREAASGYPPEVVEEWFGTPENPRVLSPDEIADLPESGQGSRDQYEKLLEEVLKDKLPAFENGDYWDTYKTAHQGFFDENFND